MATTYTADHARAALARRWAELTGRNEALAVHLRGADGRHDADSEDVVSFTAADEVLEGLEDAARAELVQIRAAFERIAAGSYGACTGCGAAIPAARLEALPHAALCVPCASAAVAR